MNNKIKELAERASSRYDQAPGIKLILNPEKFAELIIQECVGILEPKSRYMGEGPEVLKGKIRQIKRHFGVEE
jgi:hypothetical protein